MKKLSTITGIGFLIAALTGQAQTEVTSVQSAQKEKTQAEAMMNLAKEGCQKKLGFFPTVSKVACILVATGLPRSTKPQIIATVFTVCQGHVQKTNAAGIVPKTYPTLGACLSDAEAIGLINKELAANPKLKETPDSASPKITIANPEILK